MTFTKYLNIPRKKPWSKEIKKGKKRTKRINKQKKQWIWGL
jgi:hypothetical protein